MRFKITSLFFVFVLVFSSFEPVMAAEVSAPFSALDEGCVCPLIVDKNMSNGGMLLDNPPSQDQYPTAVTRLDRELSLVDESTTVRTSVYFEVIPPTQKDASYERFNQNSATPPSSMVSLLSPSNALYVDASTGVAVAFMGVQSSLPAADETVGGSLPTPDVAVTVTPHGNGVVEITCSPDNFSFDYAVVRFPRSLFPTIKDNDTLVRIEPSGEVVAVSTYVDSTNGYVYIATSEFCFFAAPVLGIIAVEKVVVVGAAIAVIGGCAYTIVKDSHRGLTPNDAISLTPLDSRSIYWNDAQNFVQSLKNKGSGTIGFLTRQLDAGKNALQPGQIQSQQDSLTTKYTPVEQDYDNAKKRGIPTKNNKDRIIGEIGEDGKNIRSLGVVGETYSSEQLFGDATDKASGCPKQIRYYGKDGKPELDIDFSHGEKPGTHSFPHKHIWENGERSKWIKDTKLEELFKTNPCKKYLEQKYNKNSLKWVGRSGGAF